MLRWLWVSALVVLLDQVTKTLAVGHLTAYRPLELLPGLNLTLMYNTGAAFSFLSGAGGWQRYFFIALALLITAAILGWLTRLRRGQVWVPVALTLVAGGALGNLWDRLTLGYVVDFIQVYYRQWSWPAFNVADSAISVGAAMLILDAFRHRRVPETGAQA